MENFNELTQKFLAFNGNVLPNKKRITQQTLQEYFKLTYDAARNFVMFLLDKDIVRFDLAGINVYQKGYEKHFLVKTGKKKYQI